MIRLLLPWPPTVNHYYRPGKKPGSHYLTDEAKAYRKGVSMMVAITRNRKALAGRLRVRLLACPGDRRARDLDNLLKGLLDALQHAGVYLRDGQIDELNVKRGSVVKNGHMLVEVEEITDEATAVVDDAGLAQTGEGSCYFEAMGDRTRG